MKRSIEYERSREEDQLLEKLSMSDDGLKEIQNDLLCNIDEEYEGDSDRLGA